MSGRKVVIQGKAAWIALAVVMFIGWAFIEGAIDTVRWLMQ